MTKKADSDDWLHLDYFANLDKNRNPHGMVCILCNKTHWIKDCPHKGKSKPEQRQQKQTLYSSYQDLDNEEGTYGW